VRVGDTLVVPKLDRLARSVPDAREIGDSLVSRGVKLSLGGSIDLADPMGKMFFNIPGTCTEFEFRRVRGGPPADAHPARAWRWPRRRGS